jgi:hypothetical protein
MFDWEERTHWMLSTRTLDPEPSGGGLVVWPPRQPNDRRDARPVSSLWASRFYSWSGSARLVWLFIGELERLTQPAEMSPKLV